MSNRGRKKVNRPRSNGNRGAKWALLIALVLLVALVAVLARLTAEKNSRSAVSETGQTDTRSVEKPPEKQPVAPESEFQFYTLLPEEGNQPPPASRPEQEDAPAVPDEPSLDAETGYLIQAGSFRKAKDADARKAALALLGVESRVATATVDGRQYHRVILGPLPGKKVPAVRRQLDEAGIETTPPRRAPG
ncbi:MULTISPECIES: SPOR domain-containing protein [unclassified Guyparkeria]|uniref:SPOR domain-containing protein n=1 Tax=unclassified Guyparkeria TaxID=2626246 RepID=UPI0007333B03|nr:MULTISPECIES: SPOR domain-containing protein [unclassified Guyparkeria]KTG17991.1 hypothetical protein AUR63_00155 [Guyparkeria sp. XI15]OAE89701.1 hypothetical protein AWR35_00155 [Guyparkeria sp. WRN-7]